ncbi:hypothetical protein ACTXT7_013412 [Hymenolepis weldensis]
MVHFPVYNSLFPVFQKSDKTFTIFQNAKESIVPVDRVKPAYLHKLVSKNATSMFPPKKTEKPMPTTGSGRHVRFPDRCQA